MRRIVAHPAAVRSRGLNLGGSNHSGLVRAESGVPSTNAAEYFADFAGGQAAADRVLKHLLPAAAQTFGSSINTAKQFRAERYLGISPWRVRGQRLANTDRGPGDGSQRSGGNADQRRRRKVKPSVSRCRLRS